MLNGRRQIQFLRLVDLAGIQRTRDQNGHPERIAEAKHINLGLTG